MSRERPNLLEETAKENSANFLLPSSRYDNVESFLQDQDCKIRIHASTVEEQDVHLAFDIDGVVMELRNLASIKTRVPFLRLPRFDTSTLLENKNPVLKKHLHVDGLSDEGIKATKQLHGHNLGFLEDSLLFLCVQPKDEQSATLNYSSKQSAIKETQKLLQTMRAAFVRGMQDIAAPDKSRPTVQKNSLTNLSKMHVLPQDQVFVLTLLDEAISYANEEIPSSSIVVYLSKMGQKDPNPLEVDNIVPVEDVVSMSVHSACTITSSQPGTNLFWSRDGLQSLVNNRGNMYPVWSFGDVVNFQSNLDNRAMDIHQELRMTASRDDARLNFIQLYAVTPHLHTDSKYKHPVSGTIVACELFKQLQMTAMKHRAHLYLDHYEELTNKICPVSARLEVVLLFEERIPSQVYPQGLLSGNHVLSLMQRFPLIVPFKESIEGAKNNFTDAISSVVKHLTSTLRTLFQRCIGVGGYDSSWKAYQYELALEYFFHGRPITLSDSRLAVGLGVHPVHKDSLTFSRGFLGLLPHGSASDGESPPPLNNWTNSDVEQRRIQRIFRLSNQWDQSPQVVAEQFMLLVIKELLKRDERIPLGAMMYSSTSPPGRLIGVLEVDALVAKMLDKNARFRYPSTIAAAFELLARKGMDKEKVLRDGLNSYKYFPAVKSTDSAKNYNFHWAEGKYVELVNGWVSSNGVGQP